VAFESTETYFQEFLEVHPNEGLLPSRTENPKAKPSEPCDYQSLLLSTRRKIMEWESESTETSQQND
jgi:hypothetical protein